MVKSIEISVEEAAKKLQISDRSVRSFIKERKIRAKKVGRRWFIDLESVNKMVQQRQRGLTEVTGSDGTASASTSVTSVTSDKKRYERSRPTNLASFNIAIEAFDMPLWKQKSGVLKKQLKEIEDNVIKALGAGYYSYGAKKPHYYSEARAQIGSAIALLYRDKKALSGWQKDIEFVELKLIPALSSLIKRMERSRK